jgi:4-diphosphocytidyl-2-C-methyl-D-erythritol kinase
MIKKSYAKVNIFLKIAGKRDNYHELVSRFVRVKNLYDTIEFVEGNFDEFTLEGDFGCETKSNTIYKAYLQLCEVSSTVEELFKNYKIVVDKKIPEFAGLGGGSSNCATVMNMINEMAELNLSKDDLASIGTTIGADVPFFIYEIDSANVTGIGEVVKPFDEVVPNIITYTPKVECNTGKIFTAFRNKFYKEVNADEANKLLNMKSIDILNEYAISSANDLYAPAFDVYNELKPENYNLPKESFFSGSGSSFFYIT